MNNKFLMRIIIIVILAAVMSIFVLSFSFNNESSPDISVVAKQKIGVLLVNHGSRSATWRQALSDLDAEVKTSILNNGMVSGISTAFMEYTEPSIATRLKEFDAEGYSHVVIVPLFLTVSPHSFDDVPTIIGQKEEPKSLAMLKMENIERYTPKAKIHVTPLLDFTDVLQKNILRRAIALSKNPLNEGLVLIAYGDTEYLTEWSALLNKVGEFVKQNTGISEHSFGWCGHIAGYNPDSTTVAINAVLKKKQTALVVPVLVAHDEMFQIKIIGDGIAKIPNSKERVMYKPDSILPDENVKQWVISVIKEYTNNISNTAVLN